MQRPDFESAGPPLCREDPEAFFPDIEIKGSLTRAAEAKKLCLGCPYLIACREYAIENNEIGIWGGTSGNERRKIKLERTRAKYASASTKLNSDLYT